MTDITIKRNDRFRSIEATLRYDDQTPINLSGTEVYFVAKRESGAAAISRACSIVDAVAGKVRFDWTDPETATAGRLFAEFEIRYPSGAGKLSVPNGTYLVIDIVPDLG